jgi:ribonuclease R
MSHPTRKRRAESRPRRAPSGAALGQYTGRIEGHPDGHGFLIPDGGEPRVHLPAAEMRQVLHGDRVRVRVTGADHRDRPAGEIVEVLERVNRRIVGPTARSDTPAVSIGSTCRPSSESWRPPAGAPPS